MKRIYGIALAISIATVGASLIYARTWLGSIGDPKIAVEGYIFHSSFEWTFLWVSFALLFALTMIISWANSSIWQVFVTIGYFLVASFALLLNDSAFRDFVTVNNLQSEHTLLNPFFLALILLVVGFALIVGHFVTISLKMKFVNERPPEEKHESKTEEDEAEDIEV